MKESLATNKVNLEIYSWESTNIISNYDYSYTAIMPCLVSDRYLEETIEALYKQDKKDILYSIIITMSNVKNKVDKKVKLEFIRKYFKKYNISTKVFISKKRLNGSKARNICLQNATSDFVGLCDSDDNWKRYKLKNEWSYLKDFNKEKDYGFWGSYSTKRYFKKRFVILPISINHSLLERYKFPHTSTWVLSKQLYKRITFDEKLERYQDLAFIIDAKKIFKNCFIINENLVTIKKIVKKKKIKIQTFKNSLDFCRKYYNFKIIYSCLFILKYFFYPRIRYFYLQK